MADNVPSYVLSDVYDVYTLYILSTVKAFKPKGCKCHQSYTLALQSMSFLFFVPFPSRNL